MKQYYNAILSGRDGDFITVCFPDFPGCVSGGKSVPDAIDAAREALAFHLDGMAEDGEDIPPESSEKELQAMLREATAHGDFCRIAVIDADLPETDNVRINISMPRHILNRIDRFASRRHLLRSTLLAQSALAYIKQQD